MKCPFCKREIGSDPNSPDALLVHCQRQYESMKTSLETMIAAKCHEKYRVGHERQTLKREKSVKKWEAWTKWVEKQIKSEKKSK